MTWTFYQNKNPIFSSGSDFLDFVENTNPAPLWNKHPEDRSGRDRESHDTGRMMREQSQTPDMQAAIKLARNGWADGLKQLDDKLKLTNIDGYAMRWANDVAGDFPNVGRYIAGLPDCMNRRIRQQGLKKPIIEIVVSACRSWDVEPDSIMNVGAAICSFIDQLEAQGYQVSVSVYTGIEDKKIGALVEIKHAGQAMPLSDMAFYIAHPAFQRRLGFAWRECVLSGREMPSGYGTPATAPKDMCPKGAIIFPRMIDNYDLNNAIAFVGNTIRQQRPELFEGEDAGVKITA